MLFPILDRLICHPLDNVIGQAVHLDGLCDGGLDNIPADILLVAGVFGAPLLAGVVVMQLSVSTGAGYARHVAAAMPAAQLPGQQVIFRTNAVPGSNRILFHPHGLLYPVPQFITHNARNPIHNADVAVNVDALVPLVLANALETALIPRSPLAGLDALCVEVSRDIHEQIPGGNTGEDFPDNSRCGLVQHDLPVCTALVPQRLPAVRHALVGVVVQTAGDVLCHVLAVKLVDIHHVPQCKTPGGSIVKIFLSVKHLYAVIVQLRLVDHGLQHIAPDAVGLPRHDGLKLSFFSIPHHLLETRPVIRLAADCPILVCTNNAQSKRSRVLRTLCDLLLDADLSLVMR